MANKKVTFLNLIATTLQAVSGITTATRDLPTAEESRTRAPFVGVIAGDESVVSEDATDIRYILPVDLILVQEGNNIEQLVDLVKNAIYAPINLGAAVRHVHLLTTGEIALIEKDGYSQGRLVLEVEYVSTKGAA